eukprot:Clim_evm75s22 gene=Clim_evmTU75s22
MKSLKKALGMGDSGSGHRHTDKDFDKKYAIGKLLGDGSFAVVHEVMERETKKKYAIKVIDRKLCKGKEAVIQSEVDIMRKVKHPLIVQLYEEFDLKDRLVLVLELVTGGELFDRIINEGSFTEKRASKISKQIIEAMAYLHSMDIVHRDLKPENILFATKAKDSDVKIADFGLSKLVNDDTALQTACGTPNYVAPEILRQQGYGKPIDMWACGVIIYIILCGYPPFYHENDNRLYRIIMKGKFEYDPKYWKDISDSAKDLINKLLVVNPSKRLSAEEALEHPWIAGDVAPDTQLPDVSDNLRRFNAKKTWQKAGGAVRAANLMKRLADARQSVDSTIISGEQGTSSASDIANNEDSGDNADKKGSSDNLDDDAKQGSTDNNHEVSATTMETNTAGGDAMETTTETNEQKQ